MDLIFYFLAIRIFRAYRPLTKNFEILLKVLVNSLPVACIFGLTIYIFGIIGY